MKYADLIAKLTLEEKAGLTSGRDFWHTKAVERLGIPSEMMTDGPHGLRKQESDSDALGLGRSVPATCFPTASALANSWDETLLSAVGRALGEEAVAQGVGMVLGPGVNIKRSPLCGRNFEYFSEDAALRQAHRGDDPWHTEHRRERVCEALCRKLAGAAPHGDRFRHGRADAARDLSPGV